MGVPEAELVAWGGGLIPAGEGWFILNAADAVSYSNPDEGHYISFENRERARFPHYGIGIHVLQPGQPNAKYHREATQESFMVLEGECTLIVEGQERHMKKWDFFHCAPNTEHITVGAGDGPCAILMVGARHLSEEDEDLFYPHHPLAEKHNAQSPEPTSDPRVAYADIDPNWEPGPFTWPL